MPRATAATSECGASPAAVYVLVAIVKKRLNLKPDLYTLLQILSVHIFQRTELRQALSGPDCTNAHLPTANQLQLFSF